MLILDKFVHTSNLVIFKTKPEMFKTNPAISSHVQPIPDISAISSPFQPQVLRKSKITKKYKKYQKVPKNTKKYLKSIQNYPKVLKSTQKYLHTHKYPKLPKLTKSTKKYPNVPNSTQVY